MDAINEIPADELPTGETVSRKHRFPYSVILSKVTMELLENPILQDPPNTSVFVERIQGWKPIPAPRPIVQKATQKDCVICAADAQIHSLLWHTYGGEKDITATVRAAQDSGLQGVTPELVKKHFPSHNYEQPAPRRRYKAEETVAMVDDLREREKRMILAVYRQRVLLSKQLSDLFFVPETSSDTSAIKSCYTFLHGLRFNHFLYQYRSQSKKKNPEAYYFLGRYSVPWVEQHEGRVVANPSTSSHADINEYMLDHDTKAANVFVQLRKQLYTNRDKENTVRVHEESLPLYMATESWHGSRNLGFTYHDPLQNKDSIIIPDGFAMLSVSGKHTRSQLPFFYEWDSGSKPVEESVGQLANYVGFALSEVVGKRFPQLQIPGYAPPVLCVTSTENRSYKLAQGLRTELERHNPDTVPMFLITDAKTMENKGFADGAWHIVHPNEAQGNLAELLIHGNRKLLERDGIDPSLDLLVDLEAARPQSGSK